MFLPCFAMYMYIYIYIQMFIIVRLCTIFTMHVIYYGTLVVYQQRSFLFTNCCTLTHTQHTHTCTHIHTHMRTHAPTHTCWYVCMCAKCSGLKCPIVLLCVLQGLNHSSGRGRVRLQKPGGWRWPTGCGRPGGGPLYQPWQGCCYSQPGGPGCQEEGEYPHCLLCTTCTDAAQHAQLVQLLLRP